MITAEGNKLLFLRGSFNISNYIWGKKKLYIYIYNIYSLEASGSNLVLKISVFALARA